MFQVDSPESMVYICIDQLVGVREAGSVSLYLPRLAVVARI